MFPLPVIQEFSIYLQEKDNSKKSTRDIKRQRTPSIGHFSAGCGALWVTYGRGHLLITLECSAGVRHVSSWSTASRRMPHDFSWMSWSQIITNLQECRNTWPEDFPAYLVLGWLMKIIQHQSFLRWKPMVMGCIQFSQTPIAKVKIWEACSPAGPGHEVPLRTLLWAGPAAGATTFESDIILHLPTGFLTLFHQDVDGILSTIHKRKGPQMGPGLATLGDRGSVGSATHPGWNKW